MDVGKLYKTAKDLNDKIQVTGIQTQLATILQNIQKLIQQSQTTIHIRQQFLATIENSKREINTAINTFIPPNLSVQDSRVYDTLGAYELFGYVGQQRFAAFFNDIQINPADVRRQLLLFQKDINKITQLCISLSQFEDKLPTSNDAIDNNDLIILFFQAGAEINNLDELAKVSTKWNQVLIAFALLCKENDTDFRIETVERGSIILTLSAIAGVVYAFAKASDKVLDVVKKYYEIKKLAYEAKQLSGVPDRTIQELENSSRLKLRTEANEITRQLVEEYGWNEEEHRKDVDAAVRMGVRHLLEFVNKGGKVDIKLLAQNSVNKEMELNMTLKYDSIKNIEKAISHEGNGQILELTEGDLEEGAGTEISTD